MTRSAASSATGNATYSLTTSEPAPADFAEPARRRRGRYIKDGWKKRSLLVLHFGEIFFYDSFVRGSGILEAVDALRYANKDTLHALLCYYVTSPEPNSHAARILYPHAATASQRVSEALAEIGLEENRRRFYHKYIEYVTGCRMDDT